MTLEIIRDRVLAIQVCTDETDPAEIERLANDAAPTGIHSRWMIDDTVDAVPCDDNPGRRHLILSC